MPPHSLLAVLEAASEVLGRDRRCVIARELTKLHEELYRSTLGDAAQHYADTAARVSLWGDPDSYRAIAMGSSNQLQRLSEHCAHVKLSCQSSCCGLQGEITLVVEGAMSAKDDVSSGEDLTAALSAAMADGHSASSAVRVVKEQTGAAKRDLYKIAVQLAGNGSAAGSASECSSSTPVQEN